jgi:hypothetical protein
MQKNASTLLSQVNRGAKLDVPPINTDVQARNHKRYTSMTVKGVAGISSNGAIIKSSRRLELTPDKDLVVNRLPALPLRIPLAEAAGAASERMERMKRKNLDRFSTVS